MTTGTDTRLDLLLDDEDLAELALAPLLDMAKRRCLTPALEEATLRLLDAWSELRQQRRTYEKGRGL